MYLCKALLKEGKSQGRVFSRDREKKNKLKSPNWSLIRYNYETKTIR